jgi:periplasmic protein TonB
LLLSALPRNALLISGVLISHLLVLLALLSGPSGGVNSSIPGALIVNLLGEGTPLSSRKKSSNPTLVNTSSNAKGNISIPSHESDMQGGGKDFGRSVNRAARPLLHSPKPHYPVASKQLKEQGLVIVRLCVNEQGIVDQVGLTQSSGFQGLDHSALKALALWRFAPLKSPSIDIASQCFQTPVQFSLEG